MVKVYSSPCIKFTVNVKLGGKSVPIVFDTWDANERRRMVSISDPDVQEKMEKCPDFNVYFKLDGIQEVDESVLVPITAAQDHQKTNKEMFVKDLMEGKRWLNSLGVPYSKMKTRDTVVGIAKDHGYDLKITNIK